MSVNGDAAMGRPTFQDLFAEVMSTSDRFGHRQHVHLSWLAVRSHGTDGAAALVGAGIRATATAAGAPQKFHHTMTRAWVEAVGYHAAEHPAADFDAFADANPGLLDKDLLGRFYSPGALAAQAARDGWTEPDLRPFPWRAAA